MESAAIIGIDLAKTVFQLHGADVSGRPLFRKKLTRDQLRVFLASHPPTIVAMEACGSAHYWGHEIGAFGPRGQAYSADLCKAFCKKA